MEFDITSAKVLPSVTEVAARALADSPNEEKALETFSDLIAEEGLALPPTLGVRDYLSRVLSLVKSRQKVRDLEPQVASLTWLGFHVPVGCSGMVSFEGSESGTRDLELSAFGSGLGSQVVLTLSTRTESGPRTTCANYDLVFRVQPTEYLVDGRKSIELSVVALEGQRIVDRHPCDICNQDTLRNNLGQYTAEQFLDIVGDSVPSTVTREYELSTAHAGSLGIEVPGVKTTLAVKLRSEQKSKVTLVYTLQPGHCYTPYVPVEPSPSALVTASSWMVD